MLQNQNTIMQFFGCSSRSMYRFFEFELMLGIGTRSELPQEAIAKGMEA